MHLIQAIYNLCKHIGTLVNDSLRIISLYFMRQFCTKIDGQKLFISKHFLPEFLKSGFAS